VLDHLENLVVGSAKLADLAREILIALAAFEAAHE